MKNPENDFRKPTAKELAEFAKLDPVAKHKYLAEKARSPSRKQMHEDTAEMLRSMNAEAKQEIVERSVSEEEADDAFAKALMAGPSSAQAFFWNTKNVFASLLRIPKAILKTFAWAFVIAIVALVAIFAYLYKKAFTIFFATLLLSMILGVFYGVWYGLDVYFFYRSVLIALLSMMGGIILYPSPDKVGFFRKSLFLAASFGIFVLFGQLFCGGTWAMEPTTDIVVITTKEGEVKSISHNDNEKDAPISVPMPNIFKGDIRTVYQQNNPHERWVRLNAFIGDSLGTLKVSAVRVMKKDQMSELIKNKLIKEGDLLKYSSQLYEEVDHHINKLIDKKDIKVQDFASLKQLIEKINNEVYGFESVVVEYEAFPYAVSGDR